MPDDDFPPMMELRPGICMNMRVILRPSAPADKRALIILTTEEGDQLWETTMRNARLATIDLVKVMEKHGYTKEAERLRASCPWFHQH